eukprot:g2726.t1
MDTVHHKDNSTATQLQPSTSRATKDTSKAPPLSAKKSGERISCFAFSHNDQYFVCGKRDGSISIWTVSTGKLDRVLHGGHKSSIADVAFRKDSLATLVSIDIHGWCIKWDLINNTNTKLRCVPVWDDVLYIGVEFAVPRLSCDGQYLGFPVYIYVEPSRENLENIPEGSGVLPTSTHSGSSEGAGGHRSVPRFYIVGYVYDLDGCPRGDRESLNPVLVLPARIDERLNFEDCMLDLMNFSHSGRRLLLTSYELSRPYLIVWPDAKNHSVESYGLIGTHGCFSQDDCYLVTWYGITSLKDQFTDSCCYLWDMRTLRTAAKGGHGGSGVGGVRWNHPNYKAENPVTLQDPDQGLIHSCGFVRLGDQIGIASVSISDTMKIVIWSLQTGDLVHVLDSGFSMTEVSNHDVRTIVRDLNQSDRVPSRKCVGISNRGQWIGVYCSIRRKCIVWDPYLGTEILRIKLPADSMSKSSALMDLAFSESATKMVMVGLTRTLLWDPCVLRSYNPELKPMYNLSSNDDDMGMGETLCRFSTDGKSIGLLRAQSFCMDIWHFHPERQFTLNRRAVRAELASPYNNRNRHPHLEMKAGKYRFGHFALCPKGRQVVTCMCDMSVLLWHTEELAQCRRIATLSSQYRPALDVCFSWTPTGGPTVVICQDQGIFVWISLLTDEVIDRRCSGGIMRCKFTSRGTTGVIMSNLYHLKVWDLISRQKIKELDYSIPLMRTVRGDFFHDDSRQSSSFSPTLSNDASFSLVGFRDDQSPIIIHPDTTPDQLDDLIWNPMDVVLSEDGEWAILMGVVDEDTDDIALSSQGTPDFSNSVFNERYPEIIYDASLDPSPITAASSARSTSPVHQTLKIIHLKGHYKSKQMRLPCDLRLHKFLAVTENGTKFAALNTCNQLVVWGTHFTYKHVIQQRWEIFKGSHHSTDPSSIERKLDEYGASLVNHPYKKGWTVLMKCIPRKEIELLKHIITWSKESGVHLSFHGAREIKISGNWTRIRITNALDLAVSSRAPHIAQIILQAIVQGATSETCVSRILEQSLIELAYKYPKLVLEFFKTSGIMKHLCTVNISESFFRSSKCYHGVLTDTRLVASPQYIQEVWSFQESESEKELRRSEHLKIQADAKVVPYPNIAKIGSEGLLQPLLVQNVEHFVFSTDLISAVINYKYFAYARSLLLEDLYHHLFLLLIFTGNCILVGQLKRDEKNNPDKNNRTESPQLFFTAVLATLVAFGSFVRLAMQVHTMWLEQGWIGLLYYAKKAQKWIELVSCLLLVIVIPMLIKRCGFGSDEVAGVMAVASVLLWMKLLFYAQAFKSTGPMVIMMREIIVDIRWFLFILFAFLVGFGVAFFVLLSHKRKQDNDNNKENPFSDPWMSVVTMILLMLSEVGDSLDSIDNNDMPQAITILAAITLVAFLAAVAIVLLNLLIAIMGDSFDRVKNHERSLFLRKRASVVQEMEMCLSHRRRQKLNARIKRYLHVLTPQFTSSVHEREWEGRLVDIQRRMRQELVDISERESLEFDGLKKVLNEIRSLVFAVLESVHK